MNSGATQLNQCEGQLGETYQYVLTLDKQKQGIKKKSKNKDYEKKQRWK